MKKGEFKFGIEAEYIIADSKNFKPLWWEELDFKALYNMLESIPIDDIPSLEGLDHEDAHQKVLPYVVEGYHIKNDLNKAIDMMPKGVEIRTPVCLSIEETLKTFERLYNRLHKTLGESGFVPISLSHHPYSFEFNGPKCNRRHDFWLWALEVMTTYGPDINISFPQEITEKLFGDKKDFEQKLYYYAPALTALSLNSPFYRGGLKETPYNGVVKSIRTWRRSTIAPMLEWHSDEDNRIEFKFFEMGTSLEDFQNYLLLCLCLGLGDELKGRALKQDGIYFMGEVAHKGLHSQQVQDILSEVLFKAPQILSSYGFDPTPLETLRTKVEMKTTLSDQMINEYKNGKSIEETLMQLSTLG